MDNIELVFNETTGEWGEKPEPYIRLEIATKEDFEFLKKAVAFYETRDDYVKAVRCKDCKYGDMCSIREAMCCTDENGYCWRGERRTE